MSSVNGRDWKYNTFQMPKDNVEINNIIWGNNEFAAVGYYVKNNAQYAAFYTSPNGINWTSRVESLNGGFDKISWDGKKYILIRFVH